MSPKNCFFLLTVTCFFSLQVLAQSTQVGVQIHGGYLIPHRPSLVYLRQGHSTGFNLTITKTTAREKSWQRAYNGPITGFDFGYLNTGNTEELGVVYSANRIINLPLGKTPQSIFRLRLGGGLGYVTQHFHKYDNVKNAAIGSNLNISILLGLTAHKNFGQWGLNCGLRFQHFSNGSFTKPNLGINIPTLYLGVSLGNSITNREITQPSEATASIEKKKFAHKILFALGTKSIGGVNNTLYGAWNIAYELRKNISEKFSWNLFTDLGYNNSHSALLRKDNEPVESFAKRLQIGAGIGIYNHYGNTAVFLQTGFYAQSKLLSNEGIIYNKFGIEQKINDRFSAQILLKSHLAKADYFALACVYTL